MTENYLVTLDRYKGFPYLIEKFNYKMAIEVGVREGFHCDHLLSNTCLSCLYGIDIDISSPNLQSVQKKYENSFIVIEGKSPEISNIFPDNHFDFIHLDGNHSEESVYADLVAWYPKLKNGGCFCGDDYMLAHDHPEGRFGVVEAVEKWATENNILYYVTGLYAPDFRTKREYAKTMWEILKERKHFNSPGWQLPQWWTIKGWEHG